MSEPVLKSVSYEDMLNDLNSIPINKNDVLFEKFLPSHEETALNETENDKDVADLNSKLEKYIIFKSNQIADRTLNSDDVSSINRLNDEFDSLEKRLNSLQHFVDVSKKFFNQ